MNRSSIDDLSGYKLNLEDLCEEFVNCGAIVSSLVSYVVMVLVLSAIGGN
jgi:hypothetical protein